MGDVRARQFRMVKDTGNSVDVEFDKTHIHMMLETEVGGAHYMVNSAGPCSLFNARTDYMYPLGLMTAGEAECTPCSSWRCFLVL